jgi:hypothetical protein
VITQKSHTICGDTSLPVAGANSFRSKLALFTQVTASIGHPLELLVMVNLDFVIAEHFQFWKSDYKVEKSHFVQVCILEPQFAVFYQLIILQRLSIPWIPKHRVARPFLPFPTIFLTLCVK